MSSARIKRLLVATSALGVAGAYGASVATASGAHAAVPNAVSSVADSLTGCLQKGKKSGQYTLRAAGGKEYQLTSQSVPLSNHVGHTVTVTGTPGGMSAGQTSGDTGAARGGMGTGMGGAMLDVTQVSMVSATCK